MARYCASLRYFDSNWPARWARFPNIVSTTMSNCHRVHLLHWTMATHYYLYSVCVSWMFQYVCMYVCFLVVQLRDEDEVDCVKQVLLIFNILCLICIYIYINIYDPNYFIQTEHVWYKTACRRLWFTFRNARRVVACHLTGRLPLLFYYMEWRCHYVIIIITTIAFELLWRAVTGSWSFDIPVARHV